MNYSKAGDVLGVEREFWEGRLGLREEQEKMEKTQPFTKIPFSCQNVKERNVRTPTTANHQRSGKIN